MLQGVTALERDVPKKEEQDGVMKKLVYKKLKDEQTNKKKFLYFRNKCIVIAAEK